MQWESNPRPRACGASCLSLPALYAICASRALPGRTGTLEPHPKAQTSERGLGGAEQAQTEAYGIARAWFGQGVLRAELHELIDKESELRFRHEVMFDLTS